MFKFPSLKLMVIASTLTLWSLVAAYLAPSCGLSTKGLLSIALAWAVFISWPALDFKKIVSNYKMSSFILTVSAMALVSQIVGWGLLSNFWKFNKPSGLFTEPSHVAMYLLPFIAYRLLKNQRDFLVLGLIRLVFAFFNSATFMVGIVLIVLIAGLKIFSRSPNKVQFVIVGMGLIGLTISSIIFGYLDIGILTDRINAIVLLMYRGDPEGIANASAIVWLNGWSQAYDTFLITNGLGLGFNQMGCGNFINVGRFSEHLYLWTRGVVLNWNDGSFSSSKLVAELGIVGLGIAIFLLFKSCRAIFKYITFDKNSCNSQIEVCTMRAAGGVCILILLLVRANGYFLEAVILDLSLLFSLNQANPLKNDVPTPLKDQDICNAYESVKLR